MQLTAEELESGLIDMCRQTEARYWADKLIPPDSENPKLRQWKWDFTVNAYLQECAAADAIRGKKRLR